MRILNNDCLQELRKLKACSVDSIVTDPPYGIGIVGADWDRKLPSREIWQECFRVLRPGGHIIAFSSARLYHKLAYLMENSGFETQNMLAWIHHGGFPKGVPLSLQFDRNDNIPRPDEEFREYLGKAINNSHYKIRELEKFLGTKSMFNHYLGKSQPSFPTLKKWKILKKVLKLDDRYDAVFERIERQRKEFTSKKKGNQKGRFFFTSLRDVFSRHTPKSNLAKKWIGWKVGSLALRPCIDPIYFGRKPPIRPVYENVKQHGVGGLNINGCTVDGGHSTNVMHDNTGAVGEASPFFNGFEFHANASQKLRKKFPHPTMKPLSLMRHLVRLVTPKGGVCLDPFVGTGTTAIAALMEGVNFVGMERDKNYFEMTKARVKSLALKKDNEQKKEAA